MLLVDGCRGGRAANLRRTSLMGQPRPVDFFSGAYREPLKDSISNHYSTEQSRLLAFCQTYLLLLAVSVLDVGSNILFVWLWWWFALTHVRIYPPNALGDRLTMHQHSCRGMHRQCKYVSGLCCIAHSIAPHLHFSVCFMPWWCQTVL